MYRLIILGILLLSYSLIYSQTRKTSTILSFERHDNTRSNGTPPTTYLKLNWPLLHSGLRSSTLNFSIPFDKERSKHVEMHEVSILSPGFKLMNARGAIISEGQGYRFYQGHIVGDENSVVAMSIFPNDEINLMVSDDEGDFQIKRYEKDTYMAYYTKDLKQPIDFQCHVSNYESPNGEYFPEKAKTRSNSARECVDVYFEIDKKSYDENGRNIDAVTNWFMALFNQVNLQFNRVGVPLRVSGLKIYDTADPYITSTDTDQALSQFRTNLNNLGFEGRLAHLISGRNLGGGIAYLNVLCSNYNNYGVSANMNSGVVSYPNYSWNVMVICHEIGHNFGSPHTQACYWNGNNTAIDGCANPEGSCAKPPRPSDGGTIMSYCHLNVGINLVKGFGPQPGDLIFSRYYNAPCALSEDCSDISPVNDICLTALELIPNTSCTDLVMSTIGASPSGINPPPACGSFGNGNDLWFKIIIPEDGYLEVKTSEITGGINDLNIQAYQGNCESLTLYQCSENNGINEHAQIIINDLSLAGNQLFLRVFEEGNDQVGSFNICAINSTGICHPKRSELINFFNALGGSDWTNNQGWATQDCDVCFWYGVHCDYQERIISIELPNNNLTGNLPANLSNLTNLQVLDLSGNNISGSLPANMDTLENLKFLNLSYNSLSGDLPESLGNIYNIRSINLEHNYLTGNIPLYLGYRSYLEILDLSDNNLEGCFPSSLSSKCQQNVDLSNNPNLPFGGDLTQFCIDYTGMDSDQDGYCFNINDCNDYDADIHDNHEEICDGKDNDCDGIIDNGFQNLINSWTGIANEDWTNPENWSLNELPKACHEVIIGPSGEHYTVNLNSQNGQVVKNLLLGSASTFNIANSSYLEIKGPATLINYGIINNEGYLSIRQTEETTASNLVNYGTINSLSRGGLSLGESHYNFIDNKSSGIIAVSGYLDLYKFGAGGNGIVTKIFNPTGIINHGQIWINGNLNISGDFANDFLILKNGSEFNFSGEYMSLNKY